jgi:hypothetical protein
MSRMRSEARREARRQLWRMRKVWPLLQVYLDRDQLADIRAFMQGGDAQAGRLPSEGWYDDVSRQRGKSWKWTVFDVVWAHCHAGQQLKYLAQTGVSVRGIIAPVIQELIEDMPPHFRPKHEGAEAIHEDKQDHKWHFPHLGKAPSTFHATGANNQHYKALRGPRAHKIVQDECGFYDDFDAVQSALLPMLLTTKGPCVYATTPAETPTHPSEVRRNGLKAQGRYVHRTIHGHPRLSPEDIDEELTKRAAEKGQTLEQFKASSYYRREYLCMHIVEEARAVVPEWSGDAGPEWPEGTTWGDVHTFEEMPRPLFYDAYDSLDIGFSRDPSAWIGGYWDWSNARLVIEAETPPLYRTRSDALAKEITEQRCALWPKRGPRPSGEARPHVREDYWEPHLSVGDGSGNGAEKLGELAAEGLHFIHANKVDLEARVNSLRTLVAQGKLYVHRRCIHLRKQLSMGLWAGTQKVDYERTEEGHLDHLSALVDLVGHVDRQRRPVPVNWGVDTHNTVEVAPGVSRGNMALEEALGDVKWD